MDDASRPTNVTNKSPVKAAQAPKPNASLQKPITLGTIYAGGWAKSGRFRVYVRGRDHMPPHVHVINIEGGEAKISIGSGWVELRRRKRMSEADANAAIRLVAERLDACLKIWKKFHQ